METLRKNITLILGISIPVLMILFVAGSIYLPGLFTKPQFNFLYVSGDYYYYYEQQYSVQNNKLVKKEVEQPKVDYYRPVGESKLYIFNVTENKANEVSFAEAQKLILDSNIKSPDGFEVVYGSNNNGFFPFFWSGTDYNTHYLSGHNISKKLNLPLNGNYYNSFRFLGWVK